MKKATDIQGDAINKTIQRSPISGEFNSFQWSMRIVSHFNLCFFLLFLFAFLFFHFRRFHTWITGYTFEYGRFGKCSNTTIYYIDGNFIILAKMGVEKFLWTCQMFLGWLA